MSAPERFPRYRQLLRLYPKAYRDRYGEQHLQALADMLDDQPTSGGRAGVWLKISFDFPVSLAHQTIALNDTPQYLRLTGLISGLLLIPFLAALTANAFDQAVNHQTLYHSWVWSLPVLRLWVLILPMIAVALSAVAFLVYLYRETQARKVSLLAALFNLRKNWPVALAGAAALGILFILFFHDSVHCFVQNPAHLVTHWHAAWVCARNR